MGQPGAKKGDQITSLTPGDVHIIMVPSPGGPVPTPIPHPCTSIIKDKIAEKVKVMGLPGAVKGSISQHTPPHVPMGPGPFQKPPANKGEIVTASSNVFYEGKEAAMLGDTAKMCCDPSDAPVGKVIGTAATVLIGGGGQGSDANRAMAAALAMLAAAAACHSWIVANMPPGADRDQAHRNVCAATGHPVDVITGKVFTSVSILSLPGRIPLTWSLDYSTARHEEDGPFGLGWRHSLQAALHVHDDFVAHRDAFGRFVPFPPVPRGGGRTADASGEMELVRLADGWTVTGREGLSQRFADASRARDASLLLQSVEDRFGNRIRLDYDGPFLRGISDAAGRYLSVDRDASGRVSRLELQSRSVQCTVARFEYGPRGELLAVADGVGAARRYEYDHGLLVRETDRVGFGFYFQYDAAARCVRTWGDGGLFYRAIAYDPIRRRTVVTDSRGGQTVYHGVPPGVAERRIDPLGGETSWQWDDAVRLTALRDANGGEWSYEYGPTGRLTTVTNPEGGTTIVARDHAGRVVAVTHPDGRRLATEWDPEGLVAAQMAADGTRYDYSWSPQGDLLEIRRDGALYDRRWYDIAGNLVRRENARQTSNYSYDEIGRLLSVRDRAGATAEFEPPRPGVATGPRRLTLDGRETRFEYNAEGGLLTAASDGIDLALSEYQWRVPTERKAAGLTSRYDLDQELNVRAILFEGFGAHEWTLDPAGRATARRVPWASGAFSYTRDPGGRRVSVTDPMGRRSELRYDALDRLVARRDAAGRETTFEYDDVGRLTLAANPAAAVTIERTPDGTSIGETFEWREPRRTAVVSISDEGELELDGEALFSYGIAPAGRSMEVRSPFWARPIRLLLTGSSSTAAMSRDSVAGEPDQMQTTFFPNGVRETAWLDSRGRPVRISLDAPDGRPIARRTYRYERGRLRASTDDRRGSWSYDYDGEGRLTSVDRVAPAVDAEAAVRFTYDALSNLTVKGRGWQWSSDGHLREANGTRFEYDALGNRIAQRTSDGRSTLFRYDDEGQLTDAVLPDGGLAYYEYDALGRRVTRSLTRSGGSTVDTCRFVWEGDRILAELHDDGSQRIFVHFPSSMRLAGWVDVSRDGDAKSYFVHTDPRGLPLEATDAAGRVVWSGVFDPFGRPIDMTATEVDCPIRLPGQYADAETGLHYNRYRYFDPAVGRYLTPDPLALTAGINPYRYCPDPFSNTDPLGLTPDDDACMAQILAVNRDIYNNSRALQTLTQAFNETDPTRQAELLREAEILLSQDHGIVVIPWTTDMSNADPTRGNQQRDPGDPGDRGMVIYDQRIILIGGPAAQPGQERANEMLHESGAILIADQNEQPAGSTDWRDRIPSAVTARDADGRPTDRSHATHLLDDITRSGDPNFHGEDDDL